MDQTTTETAGNTPEPTQEGFAAGFEDTPTPQEAPAQTQAEGATEGGAPEVRPEPEPEFVQITKAELEQLKEAAAAVAEIRSAHQTSIDKAFGKIGELQRTLTERGGRLAIKKESMDALREDFPLLAGIFEQIAESSGAEADPAQVDKIVQERVAAAQVEIERRLERKRLLSMHKDADEVFAAEDWKAYFEGLPADKAGTADDWWDADFVAGHLTAFKAQREATEAAAKAAKEATDRAAAEAAERKSRMSAAVTPRGGGGVPVAAKNSDFAAGFAEG